MTRRLLVPKSGAAVRFSLILLAACAPGPNFVTSQGIGVYVQQGVRGVTRDATSKAVAIIIGEATARLPEESKALTLDNITLDFRARRYLLSDGRKVSGVDNAGTIQIAAMADACPFSILSHEWGHVLAAVYGDGDPQHADPTLFTAPDSLEVVGKARVRAEVCP